MEPRQHEEETFVQEKNSPRCFHMLHGYRCLRLQHASLSPPARRKFPTETKLFSSSDLDGEGDDGRRFIIIEEKSKINRSRGSIDEKERLSRKVWSRERMRVLSGDLVSWASFEARLGQYRVLP